jgi:hypothetical protein
MVETHVRPICVLLLLNYIPREAELILVPQTHTWFKTEAGQQHLAQINKKTTKIAQSAHRKITRYFCTTLRSKKKVPSKKNMAVHPLSTFTHAPKRSPTVPNAGNSIAFIGG